MTNPVTQFVLDTLERASKTAAQVALLALGSEKLNVLHAQWETVGGLAAGGFVLSVLSSIASQPLGNKSTASVLPDLTSTPTVSETASVPSAVTEANQIFPNPQG